MKNGTETNISQPDYIGEWVKGLDQQKEEEIKKTKLTLYVSRNLGISYSKEYETDDKDDAELEKKIKYCDDNYLRYYIEDKDGIDLNQLCRQHKTVLSILGGYGKTTIEEKVKKLREKFCKQ